MVPKMGLTIRKTEPNPNKIMRDIIQFFNEAGWLANFLGIASFIGGCFAIFARFVRPRLAAARLDQVVPADFDRRWNDAMAKAIARVAIVDDQPADFPTAELKADGYQIQTYRQVTLATTAQLAQYDIVFLDMKGIVKDDPEEGGMKLIAELRRLNPAQKICAVSSKVFDINATEFFRQADDAKKKPLTAHECRSVINEFLSELFSTSVLRATAIEAGSTLTRPLRTDVLTQLKKFVAKELSLEQFRDLIQKRISDASLAYRLTIIGRALAYAG